MPGPPVIRSASEKRRPGVVDVDLESGLQASRDCDPYVGPAECSVGVDRGNESGEKPITVGESMLELEAGVEGEPLRVFVALSVVADHSGLPFRGCEAERFGDEPTIAEEKEDATP